MAGGVIGVDVFFVISGFVVTLQLMREVKRTGRVDVVAFWSRRVRRVLPAATLVLGVTLLARIPGRRGCAGEASAAT